MVISQGDVCWASLDDPVGSSPGFRCPVTVVQGDSFNASRIAMTAVVPLTISRRQPTAR
jgi:mRNA interferase MazF